MEDIIENLWKIVRSVKIKYIRLDVDKIVDIEKMVEYFRKYGCVKDIEWDNFLFF